MTRELIIMCAVAVVALASHVSPTAVASRALHNVSSISFWVNQQLSESPLGGRQCMNALAAQIVGVKSLFRTSSIGNQKGMEWDWNKVEDPS